jgi:hypothetical protein
MKKIILYRVTYMPPIESPSAASIPFINLFASMASSVENSGVAEPGIRAFSERYVFLASEGRRRSAIMPAEQQITLTRKW